MKYLHLMMVLLCVGLLVGCAPAVSEAGDPVVSSEKKLDSEPTFARPIDTATPTLVVTMAPTNNLTTTPTLTSPSTATRVPTNSPTAFLTAAPTPTPIPVPTSQPATEPAAASTPSEEADEADTEELVAYGVEVYKEQYCGVCHQLDAANTRGRFGPSQNGLGTTAEGRVKDPHYTGQARTAAEYIRESIVDPTAYYVEGYVQSQYRMPAFTHLSEAELDALVQMLLQQK